MTPHNNEDATLADIENITNYPSDSEENFKAALADMKGFSWTNAIRALNYNITSDLDKNWTNNASFSAPKEGTSGWFIPSIGQWVKILNISTETAEATPTYKTAPKLEYSDVDGAITNKFAEIHTTLNNKVNIEDAASTLSGCYWSLTEATLDGANSQNYCLDLSNSKFEITLQAKTSKRYLRPILAF